MWAKVVRGAGGSGARALGRAGPHVRGGSDRHRAQHDQSWDESSNRRVGSSPIKAQGRRAQKTVRQPSLVGRSEESCRTAHERIAYAASAQGVTPALGVTELGAPGGSLKTKGNRTHVVRWILKLQNNSLQANHKMQEGRKASGSRCSVFIHCCPVGHFAATICSFHRRQKEGTDWD